MQDSHCLIKLCGLSILNFW